MTDGGRFATLTGAPPSPERGVSIANVYVRADGEQLQQLARPLAERAIPAAIGDYELARAPQALTLVTHGGAGGATVLTP